ncbi:tyrosine-type recombinase/integrase, partial [Rhodopirellula sp. JC639]|uniref:tyrosine-type recombinase/integrase n=1 Tax=Stieleria mannarensis TaxID=2755585 RepID=UPI001602D3AD
WLTHHHDSWIFPAVSPGYCFDIHGKSKAERPMSETTVQGAMKQIAKKLNFGKKITIHTLRHSYATHLLEAGVGLKVIQKYIHRVAISDKRIVSVTDRSVSYTVTPT